MKKIVAIFLCGAVLFNTVGFIVLFSASIFEWKKFVAEELEKKSTSELVKIIDSKAVRYLNKHEIISGGKLYDIARITKENGKTVLYCFYDNNEEKINAQFINGIQQNTDNPLTQNHTPFKLLTKQILTEYLPQTKLELSPIVLLLSQTERYNFSQIPETSLSIQLPPPRG